MLVSSVVVVVVGERLVGGSGFVFRSVIIKIIVIVILILHKHPTCTDNCENIHQHSHTTTRESYEGKRIELFNLDPSFLTRHTFWSQVGIWSPVFDQDIGHNCSALSLSLSTKHFFFDIQTVGGYFTWMTIYAVNQTMIQRYLTVKDLR